MVWIELNGILVLLLFRSVVYDYTMVVCCGLFCTISKRHLINATIVFHLKTAAGCHLDQFNKINIMLSLFFFSSVPLSFVYKLFFFLFALRVQIAIEKHLISFANKEAAIYRPTAIN